MAEGISRHAVEVGVLAGLGNLFIFNHFMPPVTDVRRADPFNSDIEKSERMALFVGIGFTILVTAFTQKMETFAIAGAILVAADFAFKHANAVHPATGTMQGPGQGASSNVYPMPDYGATTG